MIDDRDLASALADGSAAVLVIDVQNDFCHPQGAMAALGADVSVNAALVGPLTAFLETARSAGSRIVFVRLAHDDEHRPVAARGVPPEGVCVEGSWGAEIVQEVAVEPGDLVVTKARYSAFLGTDLEQSLRDVGVETLVVVGTTANVCVDTTVRDAAQRGFAVRVLSDLVGYVRRDLAEPALYNLGLYFAEVTSSAGVAADLARIAAARDVTPA